MPHDILFQFRFFCFVFVVFGSMLISYDFLCFTAWSVNVNNSLENIHCSNQHYQPGKKTSQVSVLMIEYLVAVLWIMDGVTCAVFLASITVVTEVVIEKSGIHM